MCVLVALVSPGSLGYEDVRDEVRITAGFILNFAKFTSWPEKAARAAELTICVYGEDSFANALNVLVQGRRVRGLPVTVQKGTSTDELRPCHIAVFGSDGRRKSAHLEALKRLPVLTISRVQGFTADGGMVELFIRDNRMHFAINRRAVGASDLRISPELQELAIPR